MRVDVLSTAGIKTWGAMPATELEQSASAKTNGEENGSTAEPAAVTNGALARVKANRLKRQNTKVLFAVGGEWSRKNVCGW